jgi:hypothetical protein
MEIDTVPSTERVKHLLGIRLQMRLVPQVHNDMLPRRRDKRDVVHLGIIGHKPVQNTEGNIGLVLQDIAEESEAVGSVEAF